MSNNLFPPLRLEHWKETRDTLHKYAQMLGAIREKLSKPQPHWWHISLRVSERGLTTTPILKDKDSLICSFEIILDLNNHKLIIEPNYREQKQIVLTGQSLCALCDETCSLLKDIGVNLTLDDDKFTDGSPCKYDSMAVSDYWKALKEIDRILNKFRSELVGEKSPVQLWPHHFDMSMSWFSGRLVPGKDPDDADSSEEQLMFGFSTGDTTIPDAYFYTLAYPLPEELTGIQMPQGSYWNNEGFQGGVLMYENLLSEDNPEETLLNYFRTVQSIGAELMK
ncbi:hypothetical protein BMS3Abin03_01138 [bacterium BMS3Abin03]|nr:hypothetical protein BMS3Abin03_01138 [bacterium BMS3Abin03]